jgi:methionyl-tRNA synthetase
MIISTFDVTKLHPAAGIDMSSIDMGPIESMGVGADWGRVVPGAQTDAHQHDETETFVIVEGIGELVVDNGRSTVRAGMVIQFEPFETHYLINTGETDLVFATFYWRDRERAARAVARTGRRRFDERPIFVFSSPTTPNGDLHLGHLSGPYLGADVFTRFQRMNGVQVWHIAGSDDFQSYVVGAARRDGREPAEMAAYYADEILATHKLMDIGVDEYTISNQDPGYKEGVQDLFAKIAASDLVTLAERPALFDSESGAYLYEVDVSGGCPTCGSPTKGNACEECGEPNACVDLVEPRGAVSGLEPRVDTITGYSLALHELFPYVSVAHRLGRVPVRVKELADRVCRRERLDLPITHPADWGVSPIDSQAEGQIIWIWVDLAYRLLHGIESLGRRLGHDWRADAPQDDWKIVLFMGYDNTFGFTMFCPAVYKIAYPEWTPDVDYHMNEFLLLSQSKFSTSRRHAVWGKEVLTPDTVDTVRLYLSLNRPEGRRTNFDPDGYDAFVSDELQGTWQRWLNDLGSRIEKNYGGLAPDAGFWTPEHAAFLARLENRLATLAECLGQDGFSLNHAAEELRGIVADTTRFAAQESAGLHIGTWDREARTTVALELAAAKLLSSCAAPVIPRFAARLATALGLPEPTQWPQTVTLVEPQTRIDLARQVFFGPASEPSAEPSPEPSAEVSPELSPVLAWLGEAVREALQVPAGEPVADKTLVELGMKSLQAIALQYQILDKAGVDISVDDLLGGRTVDELAAFLANGSAASGASAADLPVSPAVPAGADAMEGVQV